MRISEMHGRGRPIFSFEFFPPKSDDQVEPLLKTISDLKSALAPNFVSVTNGAGGSTRARTLQTVTRVQRELGITAMAHLTCAGVTQDDICQEIGTLVGEGIENILALRGDPPKGSDGFRATEGGFAHASDLITYLEENYQVDIGAACYPEGHVESASTEDDLRFTRLKVESGALFLVTQLFFDNADYFAFVERARSARIRVPIIPGIMPITNVAQVERFTRMCGAKIPADLAERLASAGDDPAAVMAVGIEHAVLQCRALLEGGAPGLHFYTLNKSFATRSVLAAVRRV